MRTCARGFVFENNGENGKAINDYSEALRPDPKNPETLQRRARAYKNNGNSDLAIADYTAAIRLQPEKCRAGRWAWCCMGREGRW